MAAIGGWRSTLSFIVQKFMDGIANVAIFVILHGNRGGEGLFATHEG